MYTDEQLKKIEESISAKMQAYTNAGEELHANYIALFERDVKVGHKEINKHFGDGKIIPNETVIKYKDQHYILLGVKESIRYQAYHYEDFLDCLTTAYSPFNSRPGGAFLCLLTKEGRKPLYHDCVLIDDSDFKYMFIVEEQ